MSLKKGRVCLLGNRVTDEALHHALFADEGSAPSTMETSRACDLIGCTEGFDTEIADADKAYTQAELDPNDTPIWIVLPEH